MSARERAREGRQIRQAVTSNTERLARYEPAQLVRRAYAAFRVMPLDRIDCEP